MELQQLYIELKNYSNFDKEKNTEKFLDVADQIILLNDPNCISEFIKYFDDESEYTWILSILQKNILYFFLIDKVGIFMKSLKLFFEKSPEWATETISIIFNDETYTNLFRSNMHLADKESLLKLFDLMEEESPHHQELIQELRQELNKSS